MSIRLEIERTLEAWENYQKLLSAAAQCVDHGIPGAVDYEAAAAQSRVKFIEAAERLAKAIVLAGQV